MKEDALWAKAGHEILKEQFALNDHLMAVADGVQPVSYTHLDVYKRQFYNFTDVPFVYLANIQ